VNLRSLPLPTALIFDMDGVLVDSEPLHKRAKEIAFGEVGVVLPESTYDSYKGRPDATMIPEVLGERGMSVEQMAALFDRKRQIYEKIEHELREIPGAAEFLVWAKSRYHIALATSSTPRNRAAALQLLGVGDPFDVSVDQSGFQRPKPDPEIFLTTMKQLSAEPAECWVIEDSVNGVLAGKAAGCVVVGITTTFDRETLASAGADIVVDSFSELRGVLDSK
jgi:HAD superfamily hydrolase (TIGR01509 family)